MKNKTEMKTVELGTRRVAELMNLSQSRIKQLCDEGKLVASQLYSGASWRITLTENDYKHLVKQFKSRGK